MKTEKNILIAFILNLGFSILEFIGGAFTNSVAIISDSIHDMGDALSIGIAFFLEKKSKKQPDQNYTYGYIRYSVLGGLITTIILLLGSILVIYNAVIIIFNPVVIDYSKMILFAIFGVIINFIAAYLTKEDNSINQMAVSLHMLEDVLGWVVVLVGAIIMRFTDISLIDPIMSIGVALFIMFSAFRNLKKVLDLFLEKTPNNVSIDEIKNHLLQLNGVLGVHHVHVRSIDGYNNYATLHVISDGKNKNLKTMVKDELKEHGINHTTIEIEEKNEICHDEDCKIDSLNFSSHHHHH